MAKVNIFLHRESNTWWTDSKLKDLELLDYINKNAYGLGTVSSDKNNGLNKISSAIIPKGAKFLSGFKEPKDIEENGMRVTDEELKEILEDEIKI